MPSARRPGAGGAGLVLSLICLSILIAVAPAGATTLRRMDLPEMVAVADRIVHARTVGNRVYWDPAGRIFTDTTFDVISDAKGSGPKTLTVTQLGGRIDPIEMTVEGTPTFSPGEEVVLFTEPNPRGNRLIVGLSQGVMRVHTDPDTGEKFAVSEVPGQRVTMIGGRAQRGAAPLETLLDDVKQLATGASRGSGVSKAPAKDAVAPEGGKP
jgi:hypothetical protein